MEEAEHHAAAQRVHVSREHDFRAKSGAHVMAQQVQFYLTDSGYKAGLQKSIAAQIRQLILYYC
jgi:hypothetical protein